MFTQDWVLSLDVNDVGEKSFQYAKRMFPLFRAIVKYVFHKNIPHYTSLCDTCENTVLLAKGFGQACRS